MNIGIDIGSTYTKYCIMSGTQIVDLFSERTPIRQKEYFESKLEELSEKYRGAQIVSCGYGRKNVIAVKHISELTALALGSNFAMPEYNTILDIGGQDTKIIRQENGGLTDFFVNDRCAAGSGLFLSNVCNMLGVDFKSIDLTNYTDAKISLSSVCAVFAQSEIVELIAQNVTADEIITAVIRQLFIQAKSLLGKVRTKKLLLSGGMTQICGIATFASEILGIPCDISSLSPYFSSIGCALFMTK